MSYRRNNKTTDELRRYKIFCQSNSVLIEQIGLPSLVIEDYDAFIYFLMHGALWPNAPVEFDVDKLDKEKRRLYLLLLNRYLEAGFINPGLSIAQEELKESMTFHKK